MPGPEITSAIDAALSSPERIAAAARLLQGPAGQRSLDRLTELAARITGASTAHVAVLTEHLFVVSRTGHSVGEQHAGAEDAAPSAALNGTLCALTAAQGAALVLPDTSADARAARFPVVRTGQVQAYLGIPLLGRDGTVVGSLCCINDVPRPWSTDQVEMLTDLAGAVTAELELAAVSAELAEASTRQELVMAAGEVGSFQLEVPTGRLTLDDRMRALFGFAAGEFTGGVEEVLARIHPDDADRVRCTLAEAVSACADYQLEYRVTVPGRPTRWVHNRGRALAGADGSAVRVVGAGHDLTHVGETAVNVARILETLPTGVATVSPSRELTYLNAVGERILGTSRDAAIGRKLDELLPRALGARLVAEHDRALEQQQPRDLELRCPEQEAWFRVQLFPGDGGMSIHVDDVTERRREEAERLAAVAAREEATRAAERARQHLEVLAGLGARLGAALDEAAVVDLLLSALVPRVAPWARVELTRNGSDGPERSLAREAGRRTGAVLGERPLTARDGTVLGRLLLELEDPAPTLVETDPLLANLVDRAATAVDNARLFATQRHMSEVLQRSMLTHLPEVHDLEIAARYRPTADHAQVGGDWYDAFVQPEGGTVIAIGDVVGHDRHAAAAMGQLRNLLRGFAFDQAIAPSAVLHKVDRAIGVLAVECLATAVVAHVEPCDFGSHRLRWSSAGHLPPAVLRADGRVELLDRQANLLLGVDADTSRADHETTLHPGDALVLYTDGLVERRGRGLGEALGDLAAALASVERPADTTAEELCDLLLGGLAPARPEDDVAVIVARPR